MSKLDIFNYQDQQVRTIADENGEPWFVLNDVCAILGMTNPRMVAGRLPDDYVSQADALDGRGIKRPHTIVSEAGLYRVVLRSDKAEAETFQRWVETQVLPSIRRTGSYGKPSELEAQVPKTLPEALRAFAREVEAREAMESYARELEPKADNYDRFISGDGTYSVGNVAKMLGTSQNKLFAHLRNSGVLISKGPMRNTPYQKYMHHFEVKAYDFTRSDGTVGTSYTPRIQPTGVDFIARKLGLTVQKEAA